MRNEEGNWIIIEVRTTCKMPLGGVACSPQRIGDNASHSVDQPRIRNTIRRPHVADAGAPRSEHNHEIKPRRGSYVSVMTDNPALTDTVTDVRMLLTQSQMRPAPPPTFFQRMVTSAPFAFVASS